MSGNPGLECIEDNSVGVRKTKTGPLSFSSHDYYTSTFALTPVARICTVFPISVFCFR